MFVFVFFAGYYLERSVGEIVFVFALNCLRVCLCLFSGYYLELSVGEIVQ